MLTALLTAGAALPALAQTASSSGTGIGTSAATRLANLIARAKNRADQEITRRLNALNALGTRVNDMVRLSADEKSSLSSTIQGQITAIVKDPFL